MTTLSWIIAGCLVGGIISVVVAAAMAYRAPPSAVPMLVSYSVGALLGAAFLAVLPHAYETIGSATELGASVLVGLLVFFVLEKLVLWHHHHAPQWGEEQSGRHQHVHAVHESSGMLIVIGYTVHHFVDGVLLAAAFLADTRLGVVTTLAIMAHELPSQVGAFLILLHSGYSRRGAVIVNLLSSAAMLLGGLLGYFALHALQTWIPSLLGFVAASMIYVAVADLIPGLHRRAELGATIQQVLLIGLGIGTIYLVQVFADHGH